jgi:hypothetical protein
MDELRHDQLLMDKLLMDELRHDQLLMDKLLMDELRHDQLLMDESHHPRRWRRDRNSLFPAAYLEEKSINNPESNEAERVVRATEFTPEI